MNAALRSRRAAADELDLARIVGKIGPANAALARYDGLLQGIVNASVLLSPLTNSEAVLSSKIEGTQATVDEVLEYEAGMEFGGEKVADIQEVVNYRRTLTLATEALAERPITLLLIRQMHKVLMDSVRGSNKSPGEFRIDQNWIGTPGCAIETATFVPPSPLQLNDHLLAFEAYLGTNDFDALVQTAIVHAQFELIHPFKDGNGRIGRLIIPLFLFQKQALASPMFYLSEYLEGQRELYYARLRAVGQRRGLDGLDRVFPRRDHRSGALEHGQGSGHYGALRCDEAEGRRADPVPIRYSSSRRPVRQADFPVRRFHPAVTGAEEVAARSCASCARPAS